MTSLLQDVRYALRMMRRDPAVTAVAVFSLAVSLGPAAAMFSAIDAIGFRPLAIRDPEGLIRLNTADAPNRLGATSYADFTQIRSSARHLADIAAWYPNAVGVTSDGRAPEIALFAATSDRFFPLLGVPVAFGRPLRVDETAEAHAAPVVLISDAYWKRRYDRAPGAINSTIRLNTSDYTIVGVLPDSFSGLNTLVAPDIWLPMGAEPGPQRAADARDRRILNVIARLREGVTLAQAQAELDALAAHLATVYPTTHGNRTLAIQFEAAARRKWLAPLAAALLIIPGLVMLIACANVAGLMIGRAEARREEIATRLALGAGRRRLIRQLLTESAILALLAGALAQLVAFWAIRLLPRLIPDLPVSLGLEFRLDARVVAFTMAAALLAVPVFGLAPAFFASKPPISAMLKGAGPGSGRRRAFTFRNVLTVGQIAGSLALLVVSGLLVRSFINSSHVDVGFVRKPMIISTIAPGVAGYDRGRTAQFFHQFLDRLSALPSVEAVTLARHMPLNSLFGSGGALTVTIPGHAATAAEPLRVPFNVVEENYFRTMGVRIVRGRAFTAADRWPGAGAVLINQTMARRYWPDGDPVGRSLEITDRAQPDRRRCEIVGVVEDGKYVMLNEQPTPYVYVPLRQHPLGEATFIVRTRGPETAAMEDFRRALRELDPAMPAMQIVTLREHMRMALLFERTAAILVATLGYLALLLAIVGLYGVVSYLSTRRTREIGIRMALGARPGDVLFQIARQGVGFAVTGIAIGVLAAGGIARLMRSVLYGISSYDPLTYAGTCALVLAVALAATYIPARRAARVDPIEALRCE